MELPSYFDDFLPLISPTKDQKAIMVKEHTKLRELLMADDALKPFLLSTFIQGSHRRGTANRGSAEHPCDVDIVAVTNIPRSKMTAEAALMLFKPFLERHYPGKFKLQDRSWCIQVHPEVTIDLVLTSEPESPELREALIAKSLRDWDPDSVTQLEKATGLRTLTEAILDEARRDKEWKKSAPLWIPDRDRKVWEKTHPLFLIGWTAEKNLACNGHFAHTVKVMKWWRRHMEPIPKYPKGYPLEHVIAECCPDGIKTVAAGVAASFKEIARRYADYAARFATPFLPARGVTDPEVDVMRRVTGQDFAGFHARVRNAAELAQQAIEANTIEESARLWRRLLGPQFPAPPGDSVKVTEGFTRPDRSSRPRGEERFA